MENEKIEKLTELIYSSSKTVFFGGAGVSTESGVKDYRSEDGMYNTVREYGVPPERVLSRSYFRKNPGVFYDFCYKYFLEPEVKPNKAHLALSRLEKQGYLSSVITQNIDSLHDDAGSVNVIRLHGTAGEFICRKCGRKYPASFVRALKGKIPYCSCGEMLDSEITLYEDALDPAAIKNALSEISSADLLIVGGTSLSVYPAASFVGYFGGRNLVLINKSETDYDSSASLVIRDKIGEVLDLAVRK